MNGFNRDSGYIFILTMSMLLLASFLLMALMHGVVSLQYTQRQLEQKHQTRHLLSQVICELKKISSKSWLFDCAQSSSCLYSFNYHRFKIKVTDLSIQLQRHYWRLRIYEETKPTHVVEFTLSQPV